MSRRSKSSICAYSATADKARKTPEAAAAKKEWAATRKDAIEKTLAYFANYRPLPNKHNAWTLAMTSKEGRESMQAYRAKLLSIADKALGRKLRNRNRRRNRPVRVSGGRAPPFASRRIFEPLVTPNVQW